MSKQQEEENETTSGDPKHTCKQNLSLKAVMVKKVSSGNPHSQEWQKGVMLH